MSCTQASAPVFSHCVCHGYGGRQGFFKPLGHEAIHHRASLHANDMVIFVRPCVTDLLVLWEILNIFGETAGLSMDLDKSVATPV
jgi:hypothetical protein